MLPIPRRDCRVLGRMYLHFYTKSRQVPYVSDAKLGISFQVPVCFGIPGKYHGIGADVADTFKWFRLLLWRQIKQTYFRQKPLDFPKTHTLLVSKIISKLVNILNLNGTDVKICSGEFQMTASVAHQRSWVCGALSWKAPRPWTHNSN